MKSFYTRLLRLIDRLYPAFFAFLTLMTAFLCFRCLGIKAIDSWDEARHGISAYEMLKNGNFLVNTYLNEPDYWNVKPPVSFWSIMAGFTLFGYTSVGLRFFSALAYLITTVVTGLFARRYGKLSSLLVMAFLCANYFPFKAHLVRAGDADSLYLLFFTLAMLAMLLRDALPEVDMDKVLRMCLIHDLGECFTGDIPAFDKTAQDESTEEALLYQWVASLPSPCREEMRALYDEMAALETQEAQIYKALDKLEAVISHNESDISTWEDHEYDLQLTYGEQNVAFSPYLTALRQAVRQESLDKIAREGDRRK